MLLRENTSTVYHAPYACSFCPITRMMVIFSLFSFFFFKFNLVLFIGGGYELFSNSLLLSIFKLDPLFLMFGSFIFPRIVLIPCPMFYSRK